MREYQRLLKQVLKTDQFMDIINIRMNFIVFTKQAAFKRPAIRLNGCITKGGRTTSDTLPNGRAFRLDVYIYNHGLVRIEKAAYLAIITCLATFRVMP